MREWNGGDKRQERTWNWSFSAPPSHPASWSSCWPLSWLAQAAKLLPYEPFLCCPWVSLPSRSAGITSLSCGKFMGWTQALLSHLLPPGYTCHTLSGEDHFGQPWKVHICRSAARRWEGVAPNGLSECPGFPAFWLGQPQERQRPSAELHSHPARAPWADAGSPVPWGRSWWEPKPVWRGDPYRQSCLKTWAYRWEPAKSRYTVYFCVLHRSSRVCKYKSADVMFSLCC